MAQSFSQPISELLAQWRTGDEESLRRLVPLVYNGPVMKSPCAAWFRWSTTNSAASRITTFAENVPATRCRPQPSYTKPIFA